MNYWSSEDGKKEMKSQIEDAETYLTGMEINLQLQYVARWMRLIHFSKRFVQGVQFIEKSGGLRKPRKKIEWAVEQLDSISKFHEENFGEAAIFKPSSSEKEYEDLLNPIIIDFVLTYCWIYWNNFVEIVDTELRTVLVAENSLPYAQWKMLLDRITNFIDLTEITPSQTSVFESEPTGFGYLGGEAYD